MQKLLEASLGGTPMKNKDGTYTAEAELLKAVIKWLEPQRRDGIKVIRICDRYAKGYSDLFINARGRFVVAELKDDIGTATPHQEQFIEEMQRCGAIGGICRSVQDVADLIDKALYCTCEHEHNTFDTYCYVCGKLIRKSTDNMP
jgi:hypothetical protein